MCRRMTTGEKSSNGHWSGLEVRLPTALDQFQPVPVVVPAVMSNNLSGRTHLLWDIDDTVDGFEFVAQTCKNSFVFQAYLICRNDLS